MPKQPVIRPSYRSDAKYFRRLAHAIENDLAKPFWWRAKMVEKVNQLVIEFEAADNVEAQTPEKAQEEA